MALSVKFRDFGLIEIIMENAEIIGLNEIVILHLNEIFWPHF